MSKLKVWGGHQFLTGKQARTIVATKTKKRAAELVQMSLYSFGQYWCETGNKTELKIALANPETVFVATSNYEKTFAPYSRKERI